MSISALRLAITTAAGTPTQFTHVGLLRELITTWRGTPTRYSIVGLLREAIVACGGTPTQNTQMTLLRELITTLGGTPVGYNMDNLWAQVAALASIPVSGAPIATVAPVVSGTTRTGSVLTTTNGTWTNLPSSFAYQWFRGATAIGTNATTYTLVSADEGSNITCRVAATNATGTGFSTSAAIGPILPLAPTNTVAPVVTGTATQGNTLTTSNGTWTGSPTFAYQWKRGATAVGTNTASYVLVAGDVGSNIICQITGTNAGGNATATSNSVGPIAAVGGLDAPVLTQTSTTGVNPLQWSGTYNNSNIYDGAGNGDMMRMRFRLNGGAWTTEVDQPLDTATLLAGTFSWPLYNATSYPSGGTVDIQEQKARYTAYASCVTTNASAVVTMPSTTGIVAGKGITGSGVPVGATVLSVNSGTQITMSANATASATVTLGFETSTSAWSTQLTDTIGALAFAPSQVPSIKDYFKVSTSRCWKDTAGTIPVTADGDAVARWDSEMGVMSSFTQATSTKRPLYRTNAGHPYLDFDGVDDALDISSVTMAQPFYQAAAAKVSSFAAASTILGGSSVGQRGDFITDTTPKFQIYSSNFVANWGLTPTTNDAVYGGSFNGASSVASIDNVAGTTNNAGTTAPTGFRIGTDWNNGQALLGRIYGYVQVSAIPSSGDKASLNTWLGALQGRTI